MRMITLWKKAGKFPFRARAEFWSKSSFMQVEGFAPIGEKEFYGWNESGVSVRASQESEHWVFSETHEEDKPVKRKTDSVTSK